MRLIQKKKRPQFYQSENIFLQRLESRLLFQYLKYIVNRFLDEFYHATYFCFEITRGMTVYWHFFALSVQMEFNL